MDGKTEIRKLIDDHVDDRQLLAALHAYSRESWFLGQNVKWWGPLLYERNRTLFLPLIEQHANNWSLQRTKNLEAWKEAAEKNGDLALFRKLLSAWLSESFGWGESHKKWAELFLQAFSEASDRGERRNVVQKYNLWYDVTDELTAALYRIDPVVTRDFLIARLEREQWIDETYETTAKLAREHGDEDLYYFLYRWTFPLDQWKADAQRLATEISDPAELCRQLGLRQPQSSDGLGGDSDTFTALLNQRGADVLPYLERYVGDVQSWNDAGWEKLAKAASDHGFTGLWSTVVRTKFRADKYSQQIRDIIDGDLPDHQKVARLARIAGAQWGWAEWRRPVAIDEQTAIKLYRAYPELARTIFEQHLELNTNQTYTEFAKIADAAGDTAMLDRLIARAAIANSGWYYNADQLQALSWYAEHLDQLGDEFTSRAVNILNQMAEPPHFGRSERRTVHPVYRVLFDPTRYVDALDHVRDLLEARCSEVRELGLMLLRDAGRGAAECAVRNLDHLSAYLLNECRRSVRINAFAGLALAAEHSRPIAEDVLRRARAALDLRRNRYPEDRLIELIGRILHLWPELRSPREIPIVFGDAPVQEAAW